MQDTKENERELIKTLGITLTTEYGTKQFYQISEVLSAVVKTKWKNDSKMVALSLCAFCSHEDFDNYNKVLGNNKNYTELRTELLSNISAMTVIDSNTNIDLDSSWIELGEVFEGLGEIVSSIAEAFN